MTKDEFFALCLKEYGTVADHPFEGDFETAVFRHGDTGKWYALVMTIPKRRLGIDSDEAAPVVNLKLPLEMAGSFTAEAGVYPAYHMNKLHWVSVLLPTAPDDVVRFLLHVSHEATRPKKKKALEP